MLQLQNFGRNCKSLKGTIGHMSPTWVLCHENLDFMTDFYFMMILFVQKLCDDLGEPCLRIYRTVDVKAHMGISYTFVYCTPSYFVHLHISRSVDSKAHLGMLKMTAATRLGRI